jgi:hypothetical protein
MSDKGERKGVTVNLAAIELCYSPSVPELLETGTASEVRQALETIAFILDRGKAAEIGHKTQALLGEALRRIGKGEDANKALGLTRKKKYGAWYAKQQNWLIKDLMRQGMTRAEAEDFMGRLDLKKVEKAEKFFTLDELQSADEKLRKRIARARTK